MGRKKKSRIFLPYVKEELLAKINKISVHLEVDGVMVDNPFSHILERNERKKSRNKKTEESVELKKKSRNTSYQVVTLYDGKEIKRAPVSERYGLCDFKDFALFTIDEIEKHGFKIKEYRFDIVGGVQEIQLLSDIVMINGHTFRKSFYIINSTDRSRPLDYYLGLYCKTKVDLVGRKTDDSDLNYITDIGSVMSERIKSSKKHFGVHMINLSKEKFVIDDNIFDEQIKDLSILGKSKIKYSDLRKALLSTSDEKNAKPSKHVEFDLLRLHLVKMYEPKKHELNAGMWAVLNTPSAELGNFLENEKNNEFTFISSKTVAGKTYPVAQRFLESYDFEMDAFEVFKRYLLIYGTRDSYVVKAKSRVLTEITNTFKRLEGLNMLLGNKTSADSIINTLQPH